MTSWYEQYDGDTCGCIEPVCAPTGAYRRFSPYCRLIDVVPTSPQVYFRVAPSAPRSGTALTFNNTRTYMELRRKGTEAVLATYNAWRRDENGNIGFYFDSLFFGQPSGFYYGDIFLDCCYCLTVQLRLPPCEAFVTECYSQPAMQDCGLGECSAMDAVGIGSVGGLPCTSASSLCGTVAPYFDLNNPAHAASSSTIASCNIFAPVG